MTPYREPSSRPEDRANEEVTAETRRRGLYTLLLAAMVASGVGFMLRSSGLGLRNILFICAGAGAVVVIARQPPRPLDEPKPPEPPTSADDV